MFTRWIESLAATEAKVSHCSPGASEDDPAAWRFEVALQGDHETVFFDV